MNPLVSDIQEVLLTREQIAKRVGELAAQITQDYQGKDLVMVGVLRGAVIFFSDLFKQVELPVVCDFISISSYGASTRSSGVVRLTKDMEGPVDGKHLLIVEDIVDTGLTLAYLVDNLRTRGAASVHTCSLLDKPSRRKTPLTPDYCGFAIPDAFVVGYGLDYADRYRNLPDVCILKPEIYQR